MRRLWGFTAFERDEANHRRECVLRIRSVVEAVISPLRPQEKALLVWVTSDFCPTKEGRERGDLRHGDKPR